VHGRTPLHLAAFFGFRDSAEVSFVLLSLSPLHILVLNFFHRYDCLSYLEGILVLAVNKFSISDFIIIWLYISIPYTVSTPFSFIFGVVFDQVTGQA
jgi:hypothetical protein